MKTTTISSKRNGNVLETDYQKKVERSLGARRMEKVILHDMIRVIMKQHIVIIV